MAEKGDTTCKQQKGYTNQGKSAGAGLLEAAAVIVAGINTANAIKMADQQWDIAKDYLAISKWWRNWYNNVYKPWEDKELAEAKALKKATPHFQVAIGRARTSARAVFNGRAENALNCTSIYCTGLRGALLKDELMKESQAMAAMMGLGKRNEIALRDALDDVRWKRREQVLNRGRSMIARNVAFGNLAAGIFGDLGKQAGASAAGAIGYLGYWSERRDTVYPSTFGMGQGTPVAERTMPNYAPPTVRKPDPGPDMGHTRSVMPGNLNVPMMTQE